MAMMMFDCKTLLDRNKFLLHERLFINKNTKYAIFVSHNYFSSAELESQQYMHDHCEL